MSSTTGYVLLAAAGVPAVLGWTLSSKGLDKVVVAADEAKRAAHEARTVVANAQSTVAEATGADARAVAGTQSEIVEKTEALSAGVDDVSAALKGMTGVFAPARVFLALTFLLVLASLVALDLIAVSGGD